VIDADNNSKYFDFESGYAKHSYNSETMVNTEYSYDGNDVTLTSTHSDGTVSVQTLKGHKSDYSATVFNLK